MGLFEKFISEFKVAGEEKGEQDNATLKLLEDVEKALLQPCMYASIQLGEAIKKLKIRSEEPMKVAIVGQFSSGKSTFLNALLAKNILPTGITPVTSKINYIRYGNEFSIMVHYKDGREAFFQAENIVNFTDQRNSMAKDIDYITLYAPMPLLKDIVFVDTPGLNSQSFADTAATEGVLKEVDGIIWLTLIDNAGKMSEEEVLERYMNAYQNKSLCVLNQKDKFTTEQVEQTLNYISGVFKKYFSKVIPISAKQAVEARSMDKRALLEKSFNDKIKIFKENSEKNGYVVQKHIFEEIFGHEETLIQNSNDTLLKESNIEAVLDFIYKEIRPVSVNAKEFAVVKDIKLLILSLVEQEEKITQVYEELENILYRYEQEAQASFSTLKSRFSKLLSESFLKIEEIIEKIGSEILAKKTSFERTRYVKEKAGLFGNREVFRAYRYEAPKINSDEVYKKLFFDDDLIGKMFKGYLKSLEMMQDEVNLQNRAIFNTLEQKISKWREPNELIRKNRAVQSDIQFANLRKFASKSYEDIVKPFNDEISDSFAKISSEFRHISSLVKFNYQNATEVVIAFLERRIENSIKLYEENPTQFSIYKPNFEELKDRLNSAFHIYELENAMRSGKNFITKSYDKLSNEFIKIRDERIALITSSKNEYVKLKNELISLYERI